MMETTDYRSCQPLKADDPEVIKEFEELFDRKPTELDMRIINGLYHLHTNGFANHYSLGESFGGYLCAFYRIPLRSLNKDDMPGVRTYVPDSLKYDYHWSWHLKLTAWREVNRGWDREKMGGISAFDAHVCDLFYGTATNSTDSKMAMMLGWWLIHNKIKKMPEYEKALEFVHFIHKKRTDEIRNKTTGGSRDQNRKAWHY